MYLSLGRFPGRTWEKNQSRGGRYDLCHLSLALQGRAIVSFGRELGLLETKIALLVEGH
jgi:hypothetical protein